MDQKSTPANLTKYCSCHAKWSWLIRTPCEKIFQCTGNSQHSPSPPNTAPAKKNELHHILQLPQKVDIMIDPNHISTSFTMPRRNKQNPPTSPESVHAKKANPKSKTNVENSCSPHVQTFQACPEHPTKIHWADAKLNSPCKLVFYTRPQQAFLKIQPFLLKFIRCFHLGNFWISDLVLSVGELLLLPLPSHLVVGSTCTIVTVGPFWRGVQVFQQEVCRMLWPVPASPLPRAVGKNSGLQNLHEYNSIFGAPKFFELGRFNTW